MNKFYIWFAESPIASFLRTLAAIVLAQAVAHFAKVGYFDFSLWETWLIAGLVAALPVLLRWFNPADTLGSAG